jgi:phage terminase Nu1 subunit (DNA packaging protein)
MAEACGIAPRNFSAWRVPVAKTEGKQKLYRVADVIDNRVAHATRRLEDKVARLQERITELETAEDGRTHAEILAEQHAERTRLLRAQADAQEAKNAMQAHEVAPMDFLTYVLGQTAVQIASVMDSLPSELVRRLALKPQQLDTVRAATAGASESIAALGDEAWITELYDRYLQERER